MAVEQLTLNIQLRDDARFDNFFICAANILLVKFLKQFLQNKTQQYAYIWGKPKTGRSHLLQALCSQAEQLNLRVAYLPLAEHLSPDMLEGLVDYDLVCLDDIDAIVHDNTWQQALFHFYNQSKDAGKQLVVTGNCAPRALSLTLEDLKSRLASGVIFRIADLTDDDKIKALQLHAQYRGLRLENEVAEFLIKRWARDMDRLLTALDKLDQAALISKRKLTIPLAKETLQL